MLNGYFLPIKYMSSKIKYQLSSGPEGEGKCDASREHAHIESNRENFKVGLEILFIH